MAWFDIQEVLADIEIHEWITVGVLSTTAAVAIAARRTANATKDHVTA